ncbi:MAG: polysaccharide biosynthesis tyrosine autokinase [Planctomycetes bacterium]|nr:polysaccharide biosynthesis tyrosine autokinase [Planctomycetota bacterium]
MTEFRDSFDSETSYRSAGETARFRPLEVLFRHKWLIVLMGVVGFVLGSLYYSRLKPVYQSSAQLFVIKKLPGAVTGAGQDIHDMDQGGDLSSHLTLIRSYSVVQKAVNKPEIRSLPSLAGQSDPTAAVRNALTVTKDSGGHQANFYLTYQGPNPGDCRDILEAVTQSYLESLDEWYKKGSGDTQKLILQARDILQNQLEKKESEYKEFRLKSPAGVSKDSPIPQQEELANIQSRMVTLAVRRAEVQGHVSQIDQALKEGQHGPALLLLVSELAEGKPGAEDLKKGLSSNLEDRLSPLLLQEQELLQEYGPDHPKVKALRRRIEVTRRFYSGLASGSSEANLSPEQRNDEAAKAIVQSHLQSLKRELMDIDSTEKSLTDLFQRELGEVKKLNDFQFRDEEYRRELARSQKFYEIIIDRLQQVDLVKELGGYEASVISPAGPGARVGTKASRVLSGATLLGLLAGFGLACLVELLDKTFRSPEEIRRHLGLAVIGHIPYLRPQEQKVQEVRDSGLPLSPMLWSYYWPQSVEAEAFRAVRTALFFSTRGEGHKIIQVTSPDKSDGKTTLLSNLGVSMAQSAKTVLLMDADFRRPKLHRIFGVSNKTGLASLIEGEAELPEAIQATTIPGLYVLPCGPHPANPAELLTLPRFQELLHCIREQYDYILVDTPPLLAVTDPSIVISRVDGVVLTIRVTKRGRQDAERAKEILDGLQAHILGVAVNGVDGPAGYGYKYYQYDRKYRYGYYKEKPGSENGEAEGEGVVVEAQKEEAAEKNGHSEDALASSGGHGSSPQDPTEGAKGRRGLWRRLFLG